MKVSIVIPNYNGEMLLKQNLPKVFRAIDRSTEVIVVDDGSTDGSLNYLKTQPVKILRNLRNSGFSKTVNKGVSYAKGSVVFLLNTDAYPERGFIDPLTDHFNDPSVFAVGALDKSLEDGKIVLRGRGVGKWSRGFLMHSKGDIDKNNTLWANGGSSAFRKSIWQKLGGLNTIYDPFYWEDVDISYRALKSGYKVLFEKESVIYHEHSRGLIKSTYSNFKIRSISYRNQFIFVWENATDLSLQIKHIVFLPYHFAKAFLRFDISFFIGFVKAFILLPRIIKSSSVLQKTFVIKDSEVIKEFQK